MNFSRRGAFGVVLSLIASAASASGGGGDKKEEIAADLEILNIPLPVQRNGKLVNYLYISTELTPGPKRDIWKMRESTHFLRENIILAGHRADFSDPANPEKLDTKRAIAMVQAEAAKVYGPGAFSKVDITAVDSKRSGIAKRYANASIGSP
jgi:hypothetical protein